MSMDRHTTTPAQIREDETITQRLMEMGYAVIRFHHKADWNEIFPPPSGHFREARRNEHRHPFQTRHSHPARAAANG